MWCFVSFFPRRSKGKICQLLLRVSLRADPVGPRESPAQPKLRSAGQQQRQKRVLPVGYGIIIKWRGTHLANEHPLALFLWTLFSISLFWVRSFYPTFQSGKQQATLQRDMRGFSNPENLCLFFILLFSYSKMSENNPTQHICWIYTLSQSKLTSPHHLIFSFLSSLRAVRAVSQEYPVGNSGGWLSCCVKSSPNEKHGFKSPVLFSSLVVIWLGTSHPCDYSFS